MFTFLVAKGCSLPPLLPLYVACAQRNLLPSIRLRKRKWFHMGKHHAWAWTISAFFSFQLVPVSFLLLTAITVSMYRPSCFTPLCGRTPYRSIHPLRYLSTKFCPVRNSPNATQVRHLLRSNPHSSLLSLQLICRAIFCATIPLSFAVVFLGIHAVFAGVTNLVHNGFPAYLPSLTRFILLINMDFHHWCSPANRYYQWSSSSSLFTLPEQALSLLAI